MVGPACGQLVVHRCTRRPAQDDANFGQRRCMAICPNRPFLAAELKKLGLTRRELRTLLATGEVRRALYGVYCPTSLPDTTEVRARCAALAMPEHTVVCDRTAAWIHGIDTFDPAEGAVPPPLEVVALPGHDRTRRTDVYGGKRQLTEEDYCEIDGVLVTTPLRTACDLACLRGRHSALAVLDSFMRLHGLSRHDFETVLARYRGRRGVVQLKQLVPLASPLRESTGESFTFLAIHDAGLPLPTPQVWLDVEGFGWVRLDHAYEELKIAVEYDGEQHHSAPADRERDMRRREALERAGWIVIVVRKGDLSAVTSELWLQRLRHAIQERRPVHRRQFPPGIRRELHRRSR